MGLCRAVKTSSLQDNQIKWLLIGILAVLAWIGDDLHKRAP